jgi:D-alanyl-D-alanine carboxypeptidase/D-alanyl-D-alanine-endopeptidase (penicillin-binding protein 4)
MNLRFVLIALLNIFSSFIFCAAHGDDLNVRDLLKNGAARIETDDGRVLFSYRDEELFMPASTLKIATAFCALEELGSDFRFSTPFFLDGSSHLFVKGSGDPTLVSEELSRIALALSSLVKQVEHITIDGSLFADDLLLDGVSNSANPYDSRNAAFVGNFSTAYITRRKDGSIVSAEQQTPLTSLARTAGLKLRRGATERMNLGYDWRSGSRYGGELLAEFLKQRGVRGAMHVSLGRVPPSARTLFTHTSSQTLADVVANLLKFSTNFTANQIFLMLGINRYGAPGTVSKGQQALTECLQRRAGWRGFSIAEGSGLSRKNAVSARQMTQLLRHFVHYRDLLDTQDDFQAKTGSLLGVNSLAGYFSTPVSGRVRFAILINSPVPHLYKFTVAKKLRDSLIQRGL